MTLETFALVIICMLVMAVAWFAALRNAQAGKDFDKVQEQIRNFNQDRIKYLATEDNQKRPFPYLKHEGRITTIQDQSSWMPLASWTVEDHKWRRFVHNHELNFFPNGEKKAKEPRDTQHRHHQKTKGNELL